jgi:hypothetical protein
MRMAGARAHADSRTLIAAIKEPRRRFVRVRVSIDIMFNFFPMRLASQAMLMSAAEIGRFVQRRGICMLLVKLLVVSIYSSMTTNGESIRIPMDQPVHDRRDHNANIECK